MANPQFYSHIDPEGDIVLVLFQGHPETSETEADYDVARSDTLFNDAHSINTLTVEGMATDHTQEFQQVSHVGSRDTSLPTHPVRIKVCSNLLQKNSTVFRELLGRRPNSESSAQEPAYIPLWNDNPAILVIVLKILQDGPPDDCELEELRSVIPDASVSNKRVDLETFAQIATIVEKYQLHVAVEDYLQSWVENLWDYLENASMKTAMAWMWITWVFELTDYFDEVTKYLAKHSTRSLQGVLDLEFPIPSHILAAIDQHRLDIIGDLYTLFLSHLEPQIDASASTQYDSEPHKEPGKNIAPWLIGDAFIIGLLIIEGKKVGFWPSVEADYQGISFIHAAKRFQGIPDPRNYSVQCPSGKSFLLGHRSIPKESFVELIRTIEERDIGFSVEDYMRKTRTVRHSY